MADKITALVEPESRPQHVLVSVFLPGGADGLHLVPPIGDGDYYAARPTLGVAKASALPLNDLFGLHPSLKPLHDLFAAGELAVIHQTGVLYEGGHIERSHFEAQDYVHFGGRSGGGWLGRFLHHTRKSNAGPLTAVSIGEHVADSLHGAAAVAMRSLSDFQLPTHPPAWRAALGHWYAGDASGLGSAGRDTLSALDRIQKVAQSAREERAKKSEKAQKDGFASGLELIANLIKSDLGLRAATIELPGWDSHFGQAALLSSLMPRLAAGLATFRSALGDDLKNVTVVVNSEFGRRVGENASLGTDHGHGGVGFVLGGGVRGGVVHHVWNGLQASVLDYPGDLKVQHDYRQVLKAVMSRLEPSVDLEKVVPGVAGPALPLYNA